MGSETQFDKMLDKWQLRLGLLCLLGFVDERAVGLERVAWTMSPHRLAEVMTEIQLIWQTRFDHAEAIHAVAADVAETGDFVKQFDF